MNMSPSKGSWLLVPGGEAHKGKTPQLRDANARAKYLELLINAIRQEACLFLQD